MDQPRRSRRRLFAWITAGTVVAVAAVGALHTPAARPLLMRIGGCPMGASPAQIETAQRAAVKKTRGVTPSPARPALGFTLDGATLADVRAWAKGEGLACEELREGTLVKCAHVPASAVATDAHAAFEEIAFGFRLADKRLVNVTTLRVGLGGDEAATTLREITASLARDLGPPAFGGADVTAAELDQATPATIAYRYSDFIADVSAMRLPQRGIAVREHYMSAVD
jgi:hypothetical protein